MEPHPVKAYARLRQKLGPAGASRIVTVPGKGYKFR